mmetsp:Transcript_10466/g.28683  ORF Transcript_10466/g.28683 Transcript_10466/m.28683 type:complete len:258 (-) Transcript_10466:58-831(-)
MPLECHIRDRVARLLVEQTLALHLTIAHFIPRMLRVRNLLDFLIALAHEHRHPLQVGLVHPGRAHEVALHIGRTVEAQSHVLIGASVPAVIEVEVVHPQRIAVVRHGVKHVGGALPVHKRRPKQHLLALGIRTTRPVEERGERSWAKQIPIRLVGHDEVVRRVRKLPVVGEVHARLVKPRVHRLEVIPLQRVEFKHRRKLPGQGLGVLQGGRGVGSAPDHVRCRGGKGNSAEAGVRREHPVNRRRPQSYVQSHYHSA